MNKRQRKKRWNKISRAKWRPLLAAMESATEAQWKQASDNVNKLLFRMVLGGKNHKAKIMTHPCAGRGWLFTPEGEFQHMPEPGAVMADPTLVWPHDGVSYVE